MAFKDIASQLAQFTITPSVEAQQIGQAGAGFTGALSESVSPLRTMRSLQVVFAPKEIQKQ